jgi:hypothetical protein
LALFEAKRDLAEDFLVRQLYYPFRLWQGKITKIVKPVFLVYSNGIYRLYEYAFEDVLDYGSLRLVKRKNYSIEDTFIDLGDIQRILHEAKPAPDPPIPFPQADSFERVINLCELLSAKHLSRKEITERYAFDSRQTNYYTDAARYLALVEKRGERQAPLYSLTELGKRILNLDYKERQLAFCGCMLSHKVFGDTLRLYLKGGIMPSTADIIAIMKRSNLYQLGSDSSFERRASTIKSWLNWMIGLTKRCWRSLTADETIV